MLLFLSRDFDKKELKYSSTRVSGGREEGNYKVVLLYTCVFWHVSRFPLDVEMYQRLSLESVQEGIEEAGRIELEGILYRWLC